jgi:mannose-6-phosphate isomerase
MSGEHPLLYPWTFRRTATPKAWAGRRLASVFPRFGGELPAHTGETVEVAGCDEASVTVLGGAAAGLGLQDLIAREGWQAVTGVPGRDFPLILKLIDTAQPLSIQVHPSAGWKGPGSRGKNECWMVLDAGESACIWQGKRPGLTDGEFWRLAEAGEIDRAMVRRTVKRGDFIDNPSGLVHAIGPDLVMLELQEACPVTFRIWDWGGRSDPGGGDMADAGPRPLHLDQARTAAKLDTPVPPVASIVPGEGERVLRNGPDFAWTSWSTDTPVALHRTCGRARIFTCLAGVAELTTNGGGVRLEAGDSVLVPAAIRHAGIGLGGGAWLVEAVVGGLDPR